MFPYRAEPLTEEQVAQQDPFEGHGVKLDVPEHLGAIGDSFPDPRPLLGSGVHYASFARWAWVDMRSIPAWDSPDVIVDAWRDYVERRPVAPAPGKLLRRLLRRSS